jgi:GGDEF domain-containing protein
MRQVLYSRIQSMRVAELYDAIYRDHLTGCLNRKAFDADPRKYLLIVDLDSLKYVNDNIGHRCGDQMLCALSSELIDCFGEDSVYRLSGDEFAVRFARPTHTHRIIEGLRERFPVFSYGYGVTLKIADNDLKADKHERLISGVRADRGECPPWIDHIDTITKVRAA